MPRYGVENLLSHRTENGKTKWLWVLFILVGEFHARQRMPFSAGHGQYWCTYLWGAVLLSCHRWKM